jgi:hypothetical protein
MSFQRMIAFVFQRPELVQLLARVPEALEPVDRLVELGRGAEDHLSLGARLLGHALDAVDRQVVRGLVDVVADIVERSGEAVHVIAVERGHKRAVEQVHDLVRQAVSLVLEILDLLHEARAVCGEALQQPDKQTRDLDRVRGRLRIEREELLLLRGQSKARHLPGALVTRQPGSRVRTRCYSCVGVAETADFQAYCGEGEPRFQNDAERECAKVLDFYRVPWAYEPRTFVLERDESGRVTEAFTPDFYLPEQDLFLEITVMKQRLVTRKNRKLRKLRERYPGVHVKLFYKRDIERLAQRFRLDLAS